MRAAYDYMIIFANEVHMLVIWDQNGAVSVTNVIEDVIKEICLKEKEDVTSLPVLYRDTCSTWDAYNSFTGRFTILGVRRLEDAIKKYLSVNNSNAN